jgi:hypothetical protein
MAAQTWAGIDPSVSATKGQYIPQFPLPKHTRCFGRFPNIDQLHPGDLLLFHSLSRVFSKE